MKKFVIILAVIVLIIYLWEPLTLMNHRYGYIDEIADITGNKYNNIKDKHNSNEKYDNYFDWEYYSLLDFPVKDKDKKDVPSVSFRKSLSSYFKEDAICFKSDTTILVGIRYWYDDIHGVRSYYHYVIEKCILMKNGTFKLRRDKEIIADKDKNIIKIINNNSSNDFYDKANQWIKKNIFGN
ncbi:hypothetical protein JW835_05990 [bacterium]|nr:hypothetical protein [bacterium]